MVGCNNPKIVQDSLHVGLAQALVRSGVLVLATGCAAIALAKAGLMGEGGTVEAPSALQAFCRRYSLPPVLHMGSCVDCSRMLVLLGALADTLGVDTATLPAVASAAEWTTEKALSIGTYFAATGIPVHLGHPPAIAGSARVGTILTEELRELLGGYFFVEGEVASAAEKILAILDDRRAELQRELQGRNAGQRVGAGAEVLSWNISAAVAAATIAGGGLAGEPGVDDGAGATDAGLHGEGGDRTVFGAGAALHATVAVKDDGLAFVYREDSVRADGGAHPATDADGLVKA
jgi:hypothetical protein